jgi:hypothetical protein
LFQAKPENTEKKKSISTHTDNITGELLAFHKNCICVAFTPAYKSPPVLNIMPSSNQHTS